MRLPTAVVPIACVLANQLAASPAPHRFVVRAGFTHAQIAQDATMRQDVRARCVLHGVLP